MSSFAAEWLALREPYDGEARNPQVLDALSRTFAGQRDIRIVDLACGTGSTLRSIASRLPTPQSWLLVDNDLGLLLRASASAAPAGVRFATQPLDLSRDLEAALDGPLDLVTLSALLDLVSEEWLERLVTEVAARRLPIYAALNYDGRVTIDPADAYDAVLIAAVNRHQGIDKGFGRALGPGAAAEAIRRFVVAGYTVVQGRADWTFGHADRQIALQVLGGWAAAARETGDLAANDVVSWLERRGDGVAIGTTRISIGHVDFFAHPMAIR